MSEFVIKKEKFKFGILDKVPVAEEGECILLYRESDGQNGSYLIDSLTKSYSAAIRRGKYNMKVTLSLKEKTSKQSYRVEMLKNGFYFNVKISMKYALKDVRQYFFADYAESEKKVVGDIRNILSENDGRWDMVKGNELENTLQQKLEERLQGYSGLRFSDINVEVTPDENASILLRSDRNKDIEVHTHKNETEVKVAKNEHEGKVLDSQYALQRKRAEQLQEVAQAFGSLAPIAIEYLDGKIDGAEMHRYLEEKREKDLSVLLEARKQDWLTDQKFNEKLEKTIGKGDFMQTEGSVQIESTVRQQIEQTDKKEIVVEDGDYL